MGSPVREGKLGLGGGVAGSGCGCAGGSESPASFPRPGRRRGELHRGRPSIVLGPGRT